MSCHKFPTLSNYNSVQVRVGCDSLHITLSSLVSPSSDAHTPINIDSHPKLEDISKFVVCKITADWKQVLRFLGVEPSVINTAEADHSQCEHACTDIFEQWLSWKLGTGRKMRTWRTLLLAVEEAGHEACAQQLRIEMFCLQ